MYTLLNSMLVAALLPGVWGQLATSISESVAGATILSYVHSIISNDGFGYCGILSLKLLGEH